MSDLHSVFAEIQLSWPWQCLAGKQSLIRWYNPLYGNELNVVLVKYLTVSH